MRYLLGIIMVLLLATPAIAEHLCTIYGPHNCNEQIDDQLANITRKTAAHVSQTQEKHPFKTQNDYILAASENTAKQIKCVYVAMLTR